MGKVGFAPICSKIPGNVGVGRRRRSSMVGGLGPGIPGKTWKKWNCSVLELGKERSPSPQQRVPHPGIPWEYPQGMALQEFPELSTFSRKKFPLNSNLDTALCYSLGKAPQLLPGSTLFRGWIIGISAFFGINPSVRLGMMDEESAFQDSLRSAAGSLGSFCFRALFLGKKIPGAAFPGNGSFSFAAAVFTQI